MKKILILSLLCLIGYASVFAQNLSKLGVKSVRIRSFGEIIQAKQVKGYYYFYDVERKDRKNHTFLLSILDENLREVNSIEIVKPTYYYLIESAYNGEAFGFLFFNSSKSEAELISYDKTLKQLGSVTHPIKKSMGSLSYGMYTSVLTGMDAGYTLLTPVPDKGFILHHFRTKNEYDIEYYNNALQKQWSEISEDDKYDVKISDEAFQTADYVGTVIEKKKGIMSNDVDYDLIVNEVATGKRLFKIPVQDAKFNLSASNIFYDESSKAITIFGEFFELKDKEYSSQGIGLFYKILDMDGKLIRDKFITWNTDIAKVVPVDAKGRMEDKKRVVFHEVFKTADGHFFAVGEQYKKVASGLGIASNVLSGGRGGMAVSQLNIYDMVVFQFGADLGIQKVHFFEKDKTILTLPPGANAMTSKKLSYYARVVGGFDYKFSQMPPDQSTFISTYIDYDREKGEKAKNVFGAIVYTPEKNFTVDKIVMNRKSSDYFVYRAKPGYVMVVEYFKKEKKLDIRLEKINY